MALSSAFDKSALSAASILKNFQYAEFRRLLETIVVGISFDANASTSAEGRTTIELLVNLSSRLYSKLALEVLGPSSSSALAMIGEMTSLARRINPVIELLQAAEGSNGSTRCDARVVVGNTRASDDTPTLYVGSDSWEVTTSPIDPTGSGATQNPFGAAAAACFGAAGLFRMCFARYLGAPSTSKIASTLEDPSQRFSLLTMAQTSGPKVIRKSELGDTIDIGECFVVGVGAIGNSALWALSRVQGLSGTLHLIDKEAVDESNLQRYVLTQSMDVGRPKVEIGVAAAALVMQRASQLKVRAHTATWQEFASERGDYRFPRVLVSVDTARDRIAVQGSLPRWIVNSWTQPQNVGVSRHPSFDEGPCIACLYQSWEPRKSRDVLYAEAVSAQRPAELLEIRALLHNRRPVGEGFLKRTAQRLGVPYEPLASFANRPLDEFYHDAVCGGIVLRLSSGDTVHQVEAPLAFQSALAGVMLAAELVIDATSLRAASLPCRTEVDLLRPLGDQVNIPVAKRADGNCICHDPVYVAVYRRKYGLSAAVQVHRLAS
jgi:hypothetical protein